MRRYELRCSQRCGYQAAVANDIASVVDRMTPDECPRCTADVEVLR